MNTGSEFIFGEDRRARRTTIEPCYEPGTATSPFEPIKRIWAGVGAVMVGMFAGVVQGNSEMVQTVQTAAGDAIVMNPPDAAFMVSLVMFGVAVALVMYAAGGRR